MKIYTKTGDQGDTSLFGGQRVKKFHPRIQVYGTLDEANSVLGMALSHFPEEKKTELKELEERLIRVQNEIFQVGSELASPKPSTQLALVNNSNIEVLEKEIDTMEASLQPLKNFILQGGKPAGATLHLARTMIRKAERECVELAQTEAIRTEVMHYLNRLSDYLFVCARFANLLEGSTERIWNSHARSE